MAAGAWWVRTQAAPYLPQSTDRAVPHTTPTQGKAPQTGDDDGEWFAAAFGNINHEWRQILPNYRQPGLVIFDGSTSAGCAGRADSRSPFFCPEDGKIYLAPSFRREIPCSGAPCQFALATVLAHEVGHAVQHQLGLLGGRGGPQVELQADCLAGLWPPMKTRG
jgi:predicted metalloprotease